jgi:hypothetical protein
VVVLLACNAKNVTRFDVANIAIRPQPIASLQPSNVGSYAISGVTVFYPTDGDRCYDHDLPCTPYPDRTLELRGNTIQSGFRHAAAKQ